MRDKWLTAMISLVILIGSGCAAAPVAKEMVPPVTSSLVKTNNTLSVSKVTGGEKGSPMEGTKIDNESFKEALTNTIRNSKIFKEVFTNQQGDDELTADIMLQESTQFGFDMNAVLVVEYTLIAKNSDQEPWKKVISSKYTATFGEAMIGMERSKKAKEGVVRKNLSQFIDELSKFLEKSH